MVEFSGITQWLLKMVINPLVWLLIILFFVGMTFLFLWIKKKRALTFEGAELVDLGGNGKTGINFVKCGWFGINLHLKGLWWSGREVMRTDAMEEIVEFSEEDFQEVNGKRGVVFYRDPINKKLYPVSKLKVQNKELLAKIPPAEFVDNAIRIIDDAARETSDKMEKILQFVSWALVVVFSLVAIIVIIQMVKNGQEKAANLIVEAGKTCLENAKSVCSEIASTVGKGGNAP